MATQKKVHPTKAYVVSYIGIDGACAAAMALLRLQEKNVTKTWSSIHF